jgi:hypothetical protein
MKLTLVVGLSGGLLLGGLSHGWARINETEPEAIRRYGEALPNPDPNRLLVVPVTKFDVFKKDDYLITAFFAPSRDVTDKDPSDRVCWLTYQREPMRKLDILEIQTFLKANQEESNVWIPDGSGGFIRKDGKAYARVDNFPYQGVDLPVSVSIFSLLYFQKNGALRNDLKSKIPPQINEATLKEL